MRADPSKLINPDAERIASDPRMIRQAKYLARLAIESHGGDPDTIESDAMLGLWMAARTFDPSTGVPPSTYARHKVRFAILDGIRIATGSKFRTHRPKVLPLAEEGAWIDPDSLGAVPFVDQVDDFEALIARLSRRNKDLLRLFYLDPRCRGDREKVAEILGVRLNSIHRFLEDAHRTLRAQLEREVAS